jgi:hypothetical protein
MKPDKRRALSRALDSVEPPEEPVHYRGGGLDGSFKVFSHDTAPRIQKETGGHYKLVIKKEYVWRDWEPCIKPKYKRPIEEQLLLDLLGPGARCAENNASYDLIGPDGTLYEQKRSAEGVYGKWQWRVSKKQLDTAHFLFLIGDRNDETRSLFLIPMPMARFHIENGCIQKTARPDARRDMRTDWLKRFQIESEEHARACLRDPWRYIEQTIRPHLRKLMYPNGKIE